MSEIIGWYYLHTNGQLIYKNYSDAIVDIRESDFCASAWPWTGGRKEAWDILVEGLSLGIDKIIINKLAEQWNFDDEDAEIYATLLKVKLGIDGDKKTATRKDFINLQESPCGFGDTYLEAMADLCKQLGYKGGKSGWEHKFETLVK